MWNIFKVKLKNKRKKSLTLLEAVLLFLSIFHGFFYYFCYWLWACICFLGITISKICQTEKQPPELFIIKGVLRNVAKLTGKHLCQSLFFNKETLAQVFSREFCEISKYTFFKQHFRTTASAQAHSSVFVSSMSNISEYHEGTRIVSSFLRIARIFE